MFETASAAARSIAWQGGVLIALAVLLFALVMGVLAWSMRGRRRASRGWIVAGGVLLPIVVLLPLAIDSLARSARIAKAGREDPPALLVTVTARMWWWELRYADPAGGADVFSANELRLPLGRPVRLALASEDVIHSLWIPALAGKLDHVPGRILHLDLTPDREGRFSGRCAEYCGVAHTQMALEVVVEAPEAFDRWLARQRHAPAIEAALAARGEQAFRAHGCASCHRVQGLSDARFGPDLSRVGERATLGAGRLPNGEAALREWIAGVQTLKPGARMPSYAHLDPASLDALAAWLAAHR